MMILAFGEAITALGLLAVLTLCVGAILFCVYKLFTKRQLSRPEMISGTFALIVLVLFGVLTFIKGNIEYNPSNTSLELIVGTYSNGDKRIILNRDGKYYSKNLDEIGSGEWSNNDWNLTFSDATLAQPRIVTRNDLYGIFPYYSGVDGPDGVFLKQGSKEQHD